jgi:hypothetical protein
VWSSSFFLISSIVAVAICFGVLLLCIRSTWPYHLSGKGFMNFAMSFQCNMFLFPCLLFPSLRLL